MNSILKVSLIILLRLFIFLILLNLFVYFNPEAYEINWQNLITVSFIIISYMIIIRFFLKDYPKVVDRKISYPFFLVLIAILTGVIFTNILNIEKPPMHTGTFYLLVDTPGIYIASMLFIAPFFQEILYRKIVLDTLLVENKKIFSIFISAILYSIIQLDLNLAIQGFILGLILGFIYIAGESVKATMIVHSIYNLFILGYVPISLDRPYLIFIALLLFIFFLYNYHRITRKKIIRERGY